MLKNTTETYGGLTRFFHWLIGILFIVQFVVVYWRQYLLPPKDPVGNYLLTGLHKPIGVSLVALGLFFVLWHIVSKKVESVPGIAEWQIKIATIVKFFLLISIVLMPLSGIVMSLTGGWSISYFGLFDIPPFLGTHKDFSKIVYTIHVYTSYITLVAICLHTGAALKHHFIDKDNVLKRMITG
jgi:superoxide oxidase